MTQKNNLTMRLTLRSGRYIIPKMNEKDSGLELTADQIRSGLTQLLNY